MENEFLLAVAFVATMITASFSLLGIWPALPLRDQPLVPLTSVHIFALTFIVAFVNAYLDYFLARNDWTDRVGFKIACSMVAVFWWFVIGRRCDRVVGPLRLFAYLTLMVLFGFLGPLAIAFTAVPLFANGRLSDETVAMSLVMVTHIMLFRLCFTFTNWYVRLVDERQQAGCV